MSADKKYRQTILHLVVLSTSETISARFEGEGRRNKRARYVTRYLVALRKITKRSSRGLKVRLKMTDIYISEKRKLRERQTEREKSGWMKRESAGRRSSCAVFTGRSAALSEKKRVINLMLSTRDPKRGFAKESTSCRFEVAGKKQGCRRIIKRVA